MSQYTAEQIVHMIESRHGSLGLSLICTDLKGIDLGADCVRRIMEERGLSEEDRPIWYSLLTGGINLVGAILVGAHLEDANLQGADLQQAHLEEAYLWRTNLEGARLVNADLREAQQLWGTNLERAHLEYAKLERVDLSQASLEGAYFCNARLDKTYMEKEQIASGIGEEIDKNYALAHTAYIELKTNFKSIGYYGHASWAYIKERRMERQTYRTKRSRGQYLGKWLSALPAGSKRVRHQTIYKTWLNLRLWRLWLFNWVQDALCGYGERPWYVLGWAAVIVFVFFPFIYWITGAIGEAASFWECFIYSMLSFANVTSGDLQPVSLLGDFLRSAQVITGILLLALFVYSLGRRMSGT